MLPRGQQCESSSEVDRVARSGRERTLRSNGAHRRRDGEVLVFARRTQVDLEAQDAVVKRRGGVAEHGEVLEVKFGRFDESKAVRTFHGRQTAPLYRFSPLTESQNHIVGVKGITHMAMLGVRCRQ